MRNNQIAFFALLALLFLVSAILTNISLRSGMDRENSLPKTIQFDCPTGIYDTATTEQMENFVCANLSLKILPPEQIQPEFLSELTYTFSEGGMFEIVAQTPDYFLSSQNCPQMILRMPWSSDLDRDTEISKRSVFDRAVDVSNGNADTLSVSVMVPIRSAMHPDAASKADEYPNQPPSQLCLAYFLSHASTGAYLNHTDEK